MIMKKGKNHDIKNIGTIAMKSFLMRSTTSSGKLAIVVSIDVTNEENWPWGSEPVYMEGNIIGNISSVGYDVENGDCVLGLVRVSDGGGVGSEPVYMEGNII